MEKKKIATVWLGGCSGCHMSLLDIDERILDLVKLAIIVKCPIVDGKELPEVDITLVEGAVTSDEHYYELLNVRKKSKTVVALGDCAVTTNITGMRNYFSLQEVFDTSYKKAPGDDLMGEIPSHPVLLKLRNKVVPLQEVVAIDYVIPGCPPNADTIFYVLNELLNDRSPDLMQVKKIHYG
jgi:NAD-reducing hydrogenase small subunit